MIEASDHICIECLKIGFRYFPKGNTMSNIPSNSSETPKTVTPSEAKPVAQNNVGDGKLAAVAPVQK